MDHNKKIPSAFPSEFVDPEIKKSEAYMLQYAKAFRDEGSIRKHPCAFFFDKKMGVNRKYARGEQSTNQYKEQLGLKKNKGKFDPTYKNLNYAILKIAPKLVNVLNGRIFNTLYEINAEIIDANGIMEQKEYEALLKEAFLNQGPIQEFQENAGVEINSPLDTVEMQPKSIEDIDLIAKNNPKNQLPRELMDMVKFAFKQNDWEQISYEVIRDLIEVNIAVTKRRINNNNNLEILRVFPEKVVTNQCLFDDFRDLNRIGDYEEITIGDLRIRSKGKFDEETLKTIASKASKAAGGKGYAAQAFTYYESSTYSYLYDLEKITVFNFRFLSTDQKKFQITKNSDGNTRVRPREYGWVPFKGDKTVNSGKGYDVDEYNETFKGNSKIKVNSYQTAYKASWIVDTTYIYDNDKLYDQEIDPGNPSFGSLGYSLATTNNQSPVEIVIPLLDMIQLNWLQFQNHIANSKPKGIAVELHSVVTSRKKGQGGKSFNPIDGLQLYAETGDYVFNGYDKDGQPLPWLPIQELTGGLSADAMIHFNNIIELIDLIRMMIGINGIVEGQQAAPRTSNLLGQLAVEGSDNALTYLRKAFRSIHEGTANGIIRLIPSMTTRTEGNNIQKALGVETTSFLKIAKQLNLRELGISMEETDLAKLRESIFQILISDNSGLTAEERIEIQIISEQNPHKALAMIKHIRKIRQEEAVKNDDRQSQNLAMIEETRAKASAAAEIEKYKAQKAEDSNFEKVKSSLKIEEINTEGGWNVKVAQIQASAKIDETNTRAVTDIGKAQLNNEAALEKEELKNKNSKPKKEEKS